MDAEEFVEKHARAIAWIRERCPDRPQGKIEYRERGRGTRFNPGGDAHPVCPLGACRGAIDEAPSTWDHFCPQVSEEEWYSARLTSFGDNWDGLNIDQAEEVANFIWPKE